MHKRVGRREDQRECEHYAESRARQLNATGQSSCLPRVIERQDQQERWSGKHGQDQ
jgi:hypothetical protein